MRNRFQTEMNINRWACLMISSQRPNQNQLSIAQQFVDQFPQVRFPSTIFLQRHAFIRCLDYRPVWNLFSISTDHEQ